MTSARRVVRLREVEVEALDAARLEPLIGPERMARFEQIADAAQQALAGRVVLNINSTSARLCPYRCVVTAAADSAGSRPRTFDEEQLLWLGGEPRGARAADAERIRDFAAEFARGFSALAGVDRAVTVFGATRTPRDHPHYALVREFRNSWGGPARKPTAAGDRRADQPRSARSALRITARSMTSWNSAPATGGR